jgi:hypothetical protein
LIAFQVESADHCPCIFEQKNIYLDGESSEQLANSFGVTMGCPLANPIIIIIMIIIYIINYPDTLW